MIGAARRVPASQDGHESRPKTTLGSSLTPQRSKIGAKSLVLKDFTRKSFKLKELAGAQEFHRNAPGQVCNFPPFKRILNA